MHEFCITEMLFKDDADYKEMQMNLLTPLKLCWMKELFPISMLEFCCTLFILIRY